MKINIPVVFLPPRMNDEIPPLPEDVSNLETDDAFGMPDLTTEQKIARLDQQNQTMKEEMSAIPLSSEGIARYRLLGSRIVRNTIEIEGLKLLLNRN